MLIADGEQNADFNGVCLQVKPEMVNDEDKYLEDFFKKVKGGDDMIQQTEFFRKLLSEPLVPGKETGQMEPVHEEDYNEELDESGEHKNEG